MATGFSVLLGFVVYLAFTTYDTALARRADRGDRRDPAVRDGAAVAEPASASLGGELICYGRTVVYVRSGRSCRQGMSSAFNPWGVQLFRTLTTVVPKTAVEQAAYSKWLDQTSDREQARLDRISPGNGVIPGPLWLILFVTGGLVALYAFLFTDPDEHWLPQTVIAGSLAAMLAVSLLVIQFLNNPYTTGNGSIKPTEMEHALSEIADASAKLGIHPRTPCDATGLPL